MTLIDRPEDPAFANPIDTQPSNQCVGRGVAHEEGMCLVCRRRLRAADPNVDNEFGFKAPEVEFLDVRSGDLRRSLAAKIVRRALGEPFELIEDEADGDVAAFRSGEIVAEGEHLPGGGVSHVALVGDAGVLGCAAGESVRSCVAA